MKKNKKEQELCAFISLLRAMGIDVIAISGDSINKKITVKRKEHK